MSQYKPRQRRLTVRNRLSIILAISLMVLLVYIIWRREYFFPSLHDEVIDVAVILQDNVSYNSQIYSEAMEVSALNQNYNIRFSYPITANDAAEQLALIRREINANNDVIIIDPVDISLLKDWNFGEAEAFILDSSLDLKNTTQISSNYNVLSDYLLDLISKHNTLDNIYLSISPSADSEQHYFLDLIKTKLEDIAEYEISILSSTERIDASASAQTNSIYIAFDSAAAEYLFSDNRRIATFANTTVYALEYNPNIIQHLKSGYIDAIIAEDYYGLANLALESISSDDASQEMTLPARVITSENVDIFSNEIYLYPLFY